MSVCATEYRGGRGHLITHAGSAPHVRALLPAAVVGTRFPLLELSNGIFALLALLVVVHVVYVQRLVREAEPLPEFVELDVRLEAAPEDALATVPQGGKVEQGCWIVGGRVQGGWKGIR